MTYGPQQPGNWQSQPPQYQSQPPGWQQPPPGYGQFGPPPRKKSKAWIWVSIGVGACLLVFAGCGAVIFFGMNVGAQEMEDFFRDDPQVRANIGEIQSCSTAFWATINHPNDNVFIYDIKGTKGEGQLIIEETDSWEETVIVSAVLELSSGKKITLLDDPNQNLFD